MRHRLNSVDWTLIGMFLFCILTFIGLVLQNDFWFGVAVGWIVAGFFWTYWITYHEHREAEA